MASRIKNMPPRPRVTITCDDQAELGRVLDAVEGLADKIEVSEDPFKYYRDWQKNRYHTDAAYRERIIKAKKEQYVKHAKDPEYKARRAAYSRERYHKKKKEKEQAKQLTDVRNAQDASVT